MSTESPIVLWVDEDQARLVAVAILISRNAWKLLPAFCVADAVAMLDAGTDPSAIILDSVVVRGSTEIEYSYYPGLIVWKKLKPEQRKRTAIVSIVPMERINNFLPSQDHISKEQFFWKPILEENLQGLEEFL